MELPTPYPLHIPENELKENDDREVASDGEQHDDQTDQCEKRVEGNASEAFDAVTTGDDQNDAKQSDLEDGAHLLDGRFRIEIHDVEKFQECDGNEEHEALHYDGSLAQGETLGQMLQRVDVSAAVKNHCRVADEAAEDSAWVKEWLNEISTLVGRSHKP